MRVDPSVVEAPNEEAAADPARTKLDAVKHKGLRYAGVSVFNVIFGQVLLLIFLRLLSASASDVSKLVRFERAAEANSLAAIISAVPAYYLSRIYVWGKRGKSEMRREVLPFWVFVAIGWALSTLFAGITALLLDAPLEAGPLNPAKLAPNVAVIVSYGVLWVLRFFWMDKAFHLDHHHPHGPLDVLLDEDEPVEPDEG